MSTKPWTRRKFLVSTGAAIGAAMLGPGFTPADAKPGMPAGASRESVSPAAAELYARSLVLDANTLASIGLAIGGDDTAESLAGIRASGLTAFKTTLGGSRGTFDETLKDLAAAQALVDRYPDTFLKVVRASDIDRALQTRKVGVIFSFEAPTMLDERLDRITLFRQLGVMAMQLTYNRSSPFGAGCLESDDAPITDLGRQAVAQMNSVGVALDLSHANTRTALDAVAASKSPPLITHAGCRAVMNHPRNKPDEVLRAVAARGGVVGIYMLPFLTDETRQPMLADYIRHLVHALNVCGEDHVGIGTDSLFFSPSAADLQAMSQDVAARAKAGVGAPGEGRPPYLPDVNTPRKLEYVADALFKQGYSGSVTEKVLGRNFRRAFGEAWGAT